MSHDFAGGSDVTGQEAVGNGVNAAGRRSIAIAARGQGEKCEGNARADVAAGHVQEPRFEEHCLAHGSLRQGDAEFRIGLNQAM